MEFVENTRKSRHAWRRQFLTERLPNGTILAIRRLPMGTIKTIIDLGAHVGIFALLARFLHPEAKVIAVEPHPDSFAVLGRNVDGLSIKTIRCAVGKPGVMHLVPSKLKSASHKYKAECPKRKMSAKDDVESFSLPGLLRDCKVSTDGLYLKIDIEGAERYFLEDRETIDLFRSCVGVDFDLHGNNAVPLGSYHDWLREHFGSTHIVEYGKDMRRGTSAVLIRNGISQIKHTPDV